KQMNAIVVAAKAAEESAAAVSTSTSSSTKGRNVSRVPPTATFPPPKDVVESDKQQQQAELTLKSTTEKMGTNFAASEQLPVAMRTRKLTPTRKSPAKRYQCIYPNCGLVGNQRINII